MFYNYTEFICRSQDSAEKSTVRRGYTGSPKNNQKNIVIISSSNQAGGQKTSRRGATRPPGGLGVRPTPWPRRGPAWPLWPTSGAPLR